MTDVDLSAMGLARRAYELLRRHPLPLLLPPVLLSLLTGGGGGSRWRADPDVWRDPASMDPLAAIPFYALVAAIVAAVVLALVVALVVIVLVVVASALVYTATSRALLEHLATGAEPDWRAAFASAWPRARSLGWTYFLACLLVLAGLIALVVPGFFVLGGLLPLFAVLATETVVGRDALRRSWAISRGHKGQLALLVLAGVVAEILAGALFGWIPFLGWLASGLVGGAVTATWLCAGAILYREATHHAQGASPPPAPAASGA